MLPLWWALLGAPRHRTHHSPVLGTGPSEQHATHSSSVSLCPTHEHSQGSQHSGAARYTPLLAEALSGMLRGLISVVSQSTPWVSQSTPWVLPL